MNNQSVKIKLGNITNLSDARFAAAAGIEYMGFCFDTNNINYIAPVKAKQIIDWTSGCFVVAEFGNQTIFEIVAITEMLNIDIVEINNNLLPTDLSEIDKPIIKKIDISLYNIESLTIEMAAFSNKVDVFHLFTSNDTFSINEVQLKEICANYKIIWGLNTSSKTIKNITETYQPFALNIVGGNEEKTGVKDFEELNNILEVLGIFEG
jgi:phosphoribosylanthranilate isomerase